MVGGKRIKRHPAKKAKLNFVKSRPGAKYHKTRVHSIDGPKIASIVIWDGIKNYENEPPIPSIVIAEKFDAKKLLVIQVGKDWEEGELRFQLGIEAAYDGADVIFYAANHAVYRQLCRSIKAICVGRLQ